LPRRDGRGRGEIWGFAILGAEAPAR
jgi:hypothetical protein